MGKDMMTHSWRGTEARCLLCELLEVDYVTAPYPERLYSCSGVNLFSCCGGKSPGARWDGPNLRWVCKDCGQSQPKKEVLIDLDSLSNEIYGRSPTQVCECGSSSLGSDRHSDYCPLYVKP